MSGRARLMRAAWLALLLLMIGAPPPSAAQDAAAPLPPTVGNATMESDGTLVLWLSAETLSGSTTGHGILRVTPDDPQYEEFKRHIGGIAPGESKPVPPWPDEATSPTTPTQSIVPPEP